MPLRNKSLSVITLGVSTVKIQTIFLVNLVQ